MHTGIKVMKLTSGDTIVAHCETRKSSSFVKITDPVQFTMIYNGGGAGTMVAQQWLETDDKEFTIHKMQLVAVAEPNAVLKEYYKDSLKDINELPLDQELDEIEEYINFDTIKQTIH